MGRLETHCLVVITPTAGADLEGKGGGGGGTWRVCVPISGQISGSAPTYHLVSSSPTRVSFSPIRHGVAVLLGWSL